MPDRVDQDDFQPLFTAQLPHGEAGYPCVILAAAILRRAFQDLCISGEPGWPVLRRDAYEFLVTEMWYPNCLWRDILEEMLVKDVIIAAVHKLVKRMPDGRIVVIK